RSIEDWCGMMGPVLSEATCEERRFLMRGLAVRVECYRQEHTPRYTIAWIVAGLKPQLRGLDLPRFTDAGVKRVTLMANDRSGSSGRRRFDGHPLSPAPRAPGAVRIVLSLYGLTPPGRRRQGGNAAHQPAAALDSGPDRPHDGRATTGSEPSGKEGIHA